MATSRYQKALIERRKSQGLCVECGQPLDRNGTRCVKCRKKINRVTKERRSWYFLHNICPRCGKNDLFGDETICPECSARNTNNTLKNRNYEEYNNYHRNWAKSTYQKRKEAGLCTRCGKRKATEGRTTCGVCRERDNAARRIRVGTSDRSEHVAKGLCYFCDNPVKPGYKVCEKHYRMNTEKAAKGRELQEAQQYMKQIKKIDSLLYMRRDGGNEQGRTS